MPRRAKQESDQFTGCGYKRLQFFEDFLLLANIDHEVAAKTCGLSRSTICHWMRQQDTKLSYIQSIMEAYGYQLNILLTRDNIEVITDESQKSNKINVSKDGSISLKRLTFLLCAMMRYEISKAQLANLLGMSVNAIKTWFIQDDILISRLYQSAEAMGCSIRFQIHPKEGVSLSTLKNNNRIIITEITNTKIEIIGQKSNI